jgi:hypothetical protein
MIVTKAIQNSMHLILGGAALQRCDKCIVWIVGLAAEVTLSAMVTAPREQP